MPAAISPKKRMRIIMALRSGKTQAQVAQEEGISRRTVIRWAERHRTTGELRELPHPGRKLCTSYEQDADMLNAVFEQPLRTAKDVCEEMAFPYRTGLRRIHDAELRLRVLKKREAALQDPARRAARVEWCEHMDRTWSDWSHSTVWVNGSSCESKLSHRKRGWFHMSRRATDRPANYVRHAGRISVAIFGGLCDGQLMPLVIPKLIRHREGGLRHRCLLP